MEKNKGPVLMLIALHLRSMADVPGLFWRVRGLARTMERQEGALKVHRWMSRRSLLVTCWWRDREAADGWLGHREQRALARRAEELAAGFWVELYSLAAPPEGRGARGAPWEPPGGR